VRDKCVLRLDLRSSARRQNAEGSQVCFTETTVRNVSPQLSISGKQENLKQIASSTTMCKELHIQTF